MVENSLPAAGGIVIPSVGTVYYTTTNGVSSSTFSGGVWSTPTTIVSKNTPSSDVVGLARDSSGNLFIIDANMGTVTEATFSGGTWSAKLIVTSGLVSPLGIAVDGQDNLYIADQGSANSVKRAANNGNGTWSTPSQIFAPLGSSRPNFLAVGP